LNSPTPLVDIGINLAHDSFDSDRAEVVERARRAGVAYLLITGSSLASTRQAIQLAAAQPEFARATAGVHPHHATDLDPNALQSLSELAHAPEVVAVGECGLDYCRNFSPREAQLTAFRRQLELAVHVRKPIFLHQRDAHDDFASMLREFRPHLVGGVAHCFTAGLDEAREYLELDLYIGITGWICDERRGAHLREVVPHIPRERLLLETDGPYLLPRDLEPMPRSRRNEPMYLPHIAQAVARARGESYETLALATTHNAARLFGWPSPAASLTDSLA
jgi:TatD DNase family protein